MTTSYWRDSRPPDSPLKPLHPLIGVHSDEERHKSEDEGLGIDEKKEFRQVFALEATVERNLCMVYQDCFLGVLVSWNESKKSPDVFKKW